MNYDLLEKIVYTLCLIILYALKIIYAGYRKKLFLKELIRRKNEKFIKRQNELLKIAMESYATGPVPNLKALVNNIELNWTAPASQDGFEDDSNIMGDIEPIASNKVEKDVSNDD